MLIIYFDEQKKNKQVIKPTEKFDGNYLNLVLHITHSNLSGHDYRKNYYSFNVI